MHLIAQCADSASLRPMKLLKFSPLLANTTFAALLSLASCGKSAEPAPGSVAAPAPSAPASSKGAAMVEAASRLGFAGQLPQDTEIYFGSVNFKAQIEALRKSAFWKEVSALMDDKTPAPAAGDKSMVALQKLGNDDWFIAGSAGMGSFMGWLKEFNRFYNEMNFRALMTGATGGKPAAGVSGAEAVAGKFFSTMLQDPKQMERAQKIIADFELPPLLIGFKVEQPAEIAKQLIPEEVLKQIPADKVTVGTMTTPSGATFKTLTAEGSRLLGDKEKQDILAKLPSDLPANAKQEIEKALTAFQAKKFSVGWGAVGDYLIFASGKNLDHVKFAPNPASSLLAKPEMASLTPYLGKNLFAISYLGGPVLRAASDEQPFTPMLRGLVSAMKESPTFRDLANTLDKQLDELSRREMAVFHREMTATSAALWWDRGIHLEAHGGTRARVYQTGKPLQYARLMEQPGVVAGLAYVRDKEYEKAERAWMEQFVTSLYSAAQELVKLGMFGPDTAQKFAMFDQMGVPLLLKIYQAKINLSEKATDGETAFILDINGRMPALPGLPPEANGMKIPRITTVSQVVNRSEIAASWKIINDTITQAVATFSGGQAGGGAQGGLPMMEPISSDKNGVTSYFYAIPFVSGDLLPTSAVNDHVLMLSTSKNAVESIAAELANPAPAAVDGMVWRFDPGLLMEYLVTVSKLAPNQKPGADKEIKQVTKWAKPFHAMQGRMFEEGGAPRTSFTWEITDLISFD